MMNLVKVYSTSVNAAKQRLVKILRFGKSDVQTPLLVSPYGQDSNPIEGMVAVYGKTTSDGSTILLGFINKNSLAGVGEYRTFATDKDGVEKFYTWLKSDGTMEIGGNTNFAVKYNELKTEFDALKKSHNDFLTEYKTHVHNVTSLGVPCAPTVSTQAPNTSDITQCKNDKIKTIG